MPLVKIYLMIYIVSNQYLKTSFTLLGPFGIQTQFLFMHILNPQFWEGIS